MIIKVTIQEERYLEQVNEIGEVITSKTKGLVTTNEIMTEDRVIMAAALRGVANRFDPPKDTMR